MVLEGTARRGEGSWASPLHLVPNKSYSGSPNFSVPKTACDIRHFLGMINFYRRFLPSAAKYQSSLNDALSGLRGAQPVTWTSEHDTAFSKCKEALSEITLLTHPSLDVPLGLFTDASAHHVGASLMQRVNAVLFGPQFKVTVAPGLVLVYIVNVRRSPDTTPLLFRPSLLHRYDFDTSMSTSLDHYRLQNRYCLTTTIR
ncbi:uncharacterized protein TNCV_15411 [Trichonephila clavipes]|nr:uncharacterized protein TNCV_15411 [Trichonephila clavipes]